MYGDTEGNGIGGAGVIVICTLCASVALLSAGLASLCDRGSGDPSAGIIMTYIDDEGVVREMQVRSASVVDDKGVTREVPVGNGEAVLRLK